MAANPLAPRAPRILFVEAPDLADAASRERITASAASLGFSALLVGAPFPQRLAVGEHDLALLGDSDALAQPEGVAGSEKDVALLAKQLAKQEMQLLLDIALERAVEKGGLVAALMLWQPGRDQPLNPRAPDFGRPGVVLPWHDEQVAARLVELLAALCARLGKAGVAGFRLIGLHALDASMIKRLVARIRQLLPGTLLLAETEGLASGHVEQLAGIAFDAVFASLPWWDLRSPWFFDEHDRLAKVAPVLMPLSASHLTRNAHQVNDLARRAKVALGLGDGLLASLQDLRQSQHQAEHQAELGSLLTQVTAFMQSAVYHAPARLRLVSAPDRVMTVIERCSMNDAMLVAINSSDAPQSLLTEKVTALLSPTAARLAPLPLASESPPPAAEVGGQLVVNAREVTFLKPQALAPITAPELNRQAARRALEAAIAAPRVVIEAVEPSVDHGRFMVRANAGADLTVEADVFCDGHDMLAVFVQWRALDDVNWREAPMELLLNDRYQGVITLAREGRYQYQVVAFVDRFGSWLKDTGKKHAAALDLTLEVMEGCLLVAAIAQKSDNKALQKVNAELNKPRRNATQAFEFRLEALFNPATRVLMQDADPRHHLSMSGTFPVHAERLAAHFSSWYELFPRSMSPVPGRHGTLRDVMAHLPRVAAMGFDVLYFPPLHPIGRAHRKGRNNSLTAGQDDPGSPYAIGGPDGGHDALHPELGSLEDFLTLVEAAKQHGLELALDFAIQCSPDHPWLKDHPQWFNFRPDGSLRYAENPPKKYEDIVNVDFYSERADSRERAPAAALWTALRDVVLFWVEHGVRIFRVDNPHTKPLPFWEWMIGEVTGRFPDVLFLAEAFTAPKMMARLAKVGFTQSYTYFTWRTTKYELTSYLNELSEAPLAHVYRPHFFVNTPDINPVFLQWSGRPGFLIRAALAALLSGLWGVYSGFELCEGEPVPGKEEFMDSEKYQLRQRDFTQPGNIIAEITQLNHIRRTNPALMSHLGVTFYRADNEQILYFGRATKDRDNTLLIAVNLDPRNAQEADIEIPLWDFGLSDDASLVVDDLVEGHHFSWHGKRQRIRIDPSHRPYYVWRVAPPRA
jgi:starch synthase (maltosyl-transferring)